MSNVTAFTIEFTAEEMADVLEALACRAHVCTETGDKLELEERREVADRVRAKGERFRNIAFKLDAERDWQTKNPGVK